MNFAERAAALLVPKPFQEFLPYVSPSALKVIHKDKVLVLASAAAARALNEISESERELLQSKLDPTQKKLIVVDKVENPWPAIPIADRKIAGESLLELYFLLIHRAPSLPLDIRPRNIGWDPARRRLEWHPSRLRHPCSEDFRERVKSLYRGFFHEDAAAASNGVELYRHRSQPTDGFDERIEKLLRQHFGNAREGDVEFRMAHFKSTFHLIFEEAVRSRSRFHPELTFLGTTLAGMYVSLETLQVPLDARKAYLASASP